MRVFYRYFKGANKYGGDEYGIYINYGPLCSTDVEKVASANIYNEMLKEYDRYLSCVEYINTHGE